MSRFEKILHKAEANRLAAVGNRNNNANYRRRRRNNNPAFSTFGNIPDSDEGKNDVL